MDPDLARWRADTPAAAHGLVHLNNAGASLMPRPVMDAVVDHLRREAARGGYEAADDAAAGIAASYAAIADLIGAAPRNVAVVENATVGFAQALAAFDFQAGDVILTTRNDYASNQLMYLSLAQRLGVEVVRAEDLPEGGVDPGSVRRLVRERRPRLVAVTWIPTNSGLIQPVQAVGEICSAEGVPYLVDACQAVGQIPIDVRSLGCDYLSATARKFLRGPRGIGFLYVSDRALDRGDYPLLVDMRGADWVEADGFRLVPGAARFENWEFAYALLLGLGEAARYASAVGVAAAGRRAAGLAHLARRLLAEDDGIRVLDRGRELGAIVTLEIPGQAAGDLVAALREIGINTSSMGRTSAVLDMDDKRAGSLLRISPHYFNTEEEIGVAARAVRDLAGR